MRSIRPPESKQATTLQVAVRCRPLSAKEKLKTRDILRVVDGKVIVVLDPDLSKEYLDRVQNRSKEKKYAFDVAFGPESTNEDVYNATVSSMVEGVVRGLNATIFAYGATGSGKTHTMAGTIEDPGLMVLSLQAIFALITKQESEYEFEVTASYLEVYNEVIYDLLESSSGHLELREDPDQGITVAGLKRIQVCSAEKILELLTQGNSRRKTESTDANATSSRSHAVMEIIVRRRQRNQYRPHIVKGKLALVDLAGSERASETNNAGQKLRDGANINRSLLALSNCINALGKQQKKGLAYVPYRNSKLTRLLKDGLSGNSRTVMVATVCCGADQYHHTTNTLKYADRAKEIKTHIQTNVGTVDAHVADYQQMIDNLQVEVTQLRRELADKETQLSARTPEKEKLADDELSWLDVLSHDINENVQERINLQKALFELEDMNLHNRAELQQLDDLIMNLTIRRIGEREEALVERRQVVLDNIRDNDEAATHYRQDIENNEAQRKELQRLIDEAIDTDHNKTFLRILSQYRLLGMKNMELQFQMAIRDQIIHDQREAVSNLWLVLECSGLDHEEILEIAAQQGIIIEEGIIPMVAGHSHAPSTPIPILHKQPILNTSSGRFPTLGQQQTGPDTNMVPEYRNQGSRPGCEEGDTATCSPKTTRDDWKNLSPRGNGEQPQLGFIPSWLQPSTYWTCTDSLRVGLGHVNGDGIGSYTPEKLRLSRTPWSVDSACSGRLGTVHIDTSSGGNMMVNDPLLPATNEHRILTPSRSRRRPRSAESEHQRRWLHERDGSTTGIDAGSEGSETEDFDHSRVETQARAHLQKVEGGSHLSIDNHLLRKELSRLDSELQDLKRGINQKTTSLLNGSKIHASPMHSTDFKNTRRPVTWTSTSAPKLTVNQVISNGSQASAPITLNIYSPVMHSSGRVHRNQYTPFSVFSTPPLSDVQPWKQVGSDDQGGVGLEEAISAKVLQPTQSDLNESYNVVNSRKPTLIDQRRSKFENLPNGVCHVSTGNAAEWK
ncbi:unnamed protein product [Sphagnum compactum]